MARSDVVVIGGGLAGLGAATELARAGRSVVLLEGGRALGGRARSQVKAGFTLNLGPHALYRTGEAKALLDRLGVPVRGRVPVARGLALDRLDLPALPLDPWSVARTPLLAAGERWEVARWLAAVAVGDARALVGRSVADWLAGLSPGARGCAAAVVRVATYAADHEALDAGATLVQLKRALRGVLYLHGGWQTVVDGLRSAAVRAGVRIAVGEPARSVEGTVVHTDARSYEADAVLLATGPQVAASLTGSGLLAERLGAMRPVRAACLDLGLVGGFDASRRFGLGVDRPLYFSEHASVAELGPEGGALVQAAVYGADGEPDALRAELEAVVDRMQPGWRQRVVVERWLPALTVAHDLPRAAVGGERAPVAVVDRPGVFVAGDWVGSDGMLADAAAASATAAVRAILRVGQEVAA